MLTVLDQYQGTTEQTLTSEVAWFGPLTTVRGSEARRDSPKCRGRHSPHLNLSDEICCGL